MDKIIEAIIKALPILAAFGYFGIEEDSGKRLTAIAVAVLIAITGSLLKKYQERRKYKREAENLRPQFDYKSIREATQFYIPTQFQNASPARQDEPKFTHKYVQRGALIPFFLKTAFNEKRDKDADRFYLILADSGMGKTTFLVNLYMKYISFWNRQREKGISIKLFRLGLSDTLDWVKDIKRKEAINTILLLDALDEDPHIIPKDNSISDGEAFRKRVDEIIEATKYFREVVLTCRTQYFPGQEDDPYELKVPRPDEKGYYILNKLYISPFNDKEVKQYLNKKYPFWKIWQRRKKHQAAKIVKNSPKLVVRPMLLNYIDLLTEDKTDYKTVYAIYESLIEKWLIREAEKRKPIKERKQFIKNLRSLSQQTALSIYKQRGINKGLFLTKEQAVIIAQNNQIDLKPDEVTGKSLLTSDGQGNWKFAHKSILEFFLAKYAVEDFDFFAEIAEIDFAGMDMVKTFCLEKGEFVFVKGGTFIMRDKHGDLQEATKPVHEITIPDFYMAKYSVTQKLWKKIMRDNPSHFKGSDNPVEMLSWYDALKFIKKLNDITGLKFRLPSRAEWEFAARGGMQSKGYKYAGSNDIDEVAWYNKNSDRKTHPVGKKKANELGIYDMSGNVWEWCQDKWQDSYKNAPADGSAWESGDSSPRVIRGGSWYDGAVNCRVANRGGNGAADRGDNVGFRLALSL